MATLNTSRSMKSVNYSFPLLLSRACGYHANDFSNPKIVSVSPLRNAMTSSSIKRIGIVLKPHQPDALKTMCELTAWLAQRGITPVGGPEIERASIEEQTGCAVEEITTEQLAAKCRSASRARW